MLFRKRPSSEPVGRRPLRGQPGDAMRQNQTFSYYANRSASDSGARMSPQQAERQPSRRRMRSFVRHLPVLIVCIIIAVCVLSELTLSSSPKIVPLSTSSAQVFLRSTDTYQQAAAALFKKSFTNHNKLTVDAAAISTALKQEFPELSDVSVTLPFLGHRPIVYVQPSEPMLILQTQSGDFVLDSSGKALLPASNVAQLSALKVPTVTDQSGLQTATGRTALPSNDVTFIHTVYAQLQAQHTSVQRVVLPAAASEVDFYIGGTPYFVKFNLQSDARQQAGTYLAVANNLASKRVTPAHYVDVRVDGRAYYK